MHYLLFLYQKHHQFYATKFTRAETTDTILHEFANKPKNESHPSPKCKNVQKMYENYYLCQRTVTNDLRRLAYDTFSMMITSKINHYSVNFSIFFKDSTFDFYLIFKIYLNYYIWLTSQSDKVKVDNNNIEGKTQSI